MSDKGSVIIRNCINAFLLFQVRWTLDMHKIWTPLIPTINLMIHNQAFTF